MGVLWKVDIGSVFTDGWDHWWWHRWLIFAHIILVVSIFPNFIHKILVFPYLSVKWLIVSVSVTTLLRFLNHSSISALLLITEKLSAPIRAFAIASQSNFKQLTQEINKHNNQTNSAVEVAGKCDNVYRTKNRLMVAFDSKKGPNLKVVKWSWKL